MPKYTEEVAKMYDHVRQEKMSEHRCPEPRTPEERLNRSLRRCGHYLYHHSAGQRQRMVLRLLEENGTMSQKDIQESLNIQPGSVSELISKLERKGLVERQRDEDDRRRVTLHLTEAGKEVQRTDRDTWMRESYQVLSGEEMEQMTRLLERLLDSWEGA